MSESVPRYQSNKEANGLAVEDLCVCGGGEGSGRDKTGLRILETRWPAGRGWCGRTGAP